MRGYIKLTKCGNGIAWIISSLFLLFPILSSCCVKFVAVACSVCVAWWSQPKWDGGDLLDPLEFNNIQESSTTSIISSYSLHICNLGINVVLMHMLIAPALHKKEKSRLFTFLLKTRKTNGVGNSFTPLVISLVLDKNVFIIIIVCMQSFLFIIIVYLIGKQVLLS